MKKRDYLYIVAVISYIILPSLLAVLFYSLFGITREGIVLMLMCAVLTGIAGFAVFDLDRD